MYKFAILGAFLWLVSSDIAQGQILPRKRDAERSNVQRLPNDQLEGALWEYKLIRELPESKQKRKELEQAKAPNELTGRWRIEENAVYESAEVKPLENPGQRLAQLKQGKAELKLPEAPVPDRVGDVKRLENGRLKIEFVESQPIRGSVTIWRKEGFKDVWEGFAWETDVEGTRIQKWQVEMRLIED